MDPNSTNNQYNQPLTPQSQSLMSRIFPANMPPRTKKLIIFSLGGLFLILVFIIPAILQSTPSNQNDAGSVSNNKAASSEQLGKLDNRYNTVSRVGTKSETDQYTINAKVLSYTTKNDVTTFTVDLTKGVLIDAKSTLLLKTKTEQLPPTNILPTDATFTINCAGTGGLLGSKECALDKLTILDKPQKTLSYLEVAKAMNQWISKQKNQKGGYNVGQTCDAQGNCKADGVDNRVGIAAIYATYRLYKTETNAEVKKQLLTSLDNDVKAHTELILQNDYLNCPWMYEIRKDTSLPQSIREGVAILCWGGQYPRPLSNNTADPDSYITSTLPTILNGKENIVPLSTIQETGPLEYASAYTADFATQAQWQIADPIPTGPLVFTPLPKAKQRFAEAIRIYSETELLFHPDVCTMGTAAIHMYDTTKESTYLNFATELTNKIDFGEECSNEISQSECGRYLRAATLCADFMHRLQKVTKDTRHITARNKILDFLIQYKWDQEGYAGVMLNDHAFYHLGSDLNVKLANSTKPLQENAILMGLFAEIQKK